jgi:thiol:disulfide interchange protein DsbC
MNMTSHNHFTAIALTLLMLACLSGAAHATDQKVTARETTATEIPPAITAALLRIMPSRQADSISPAAISGLYEVNFGTDIFYITADAKHLLQGDLYALDTQTNLTEAKRTAGRVTLINTIDPATMIIFKPANPRYVVTIFTDIDCGYCRKLHSEIDTYMANGIEIRYLAFPRSGINTRSYFKAVSAWCADDRKQALTIAKTGVEIDNKSCENPVDQHMAIAQQLGITGTPTLILADGTMLPGYLPADRLRQYLDGL